jgi:hypothetical protein
VDTAARAAADPTTLSMMEETAAKFQKLASLRGVGATITVNRECGTYVANDVDCGTSVHGLYEWLDQQKV